MHHRRRRRPGPLQKRHCLARYFGVVRGLKQSGKSTKTRASIAPMGNLRITLWLRTFYERLRAAGKPAKLALVAAPGKLTHAVYSLDKHGRPFEIRTEHAPVA